MQDFETIYALIGPAGVALIFVGIFWILSMAKTGV